MNKQFTRYLQIALLGLDLFSMNFVIFLCQEWVKNYLVEDALLNFTSFWIAFNVLWILFAYTGNVYGMKRIFSFEAFSQRTLRIYFLWSGVILLYLFLFSNQSFSRSYILLLLVCIGISFILNRFFYLLIRHIYRDNEYLVKKVLILGYNDSAKKMASYLEEYGIGTEIVGYCEETENMRELSNYPILSGVGEALRVSKEYNVTEIYSTITPEQNLKIYDFMKEADQACIRFRIIPDFSFFIKRPVHVDYFRDIPVLSLRSEPLDDLSNRIKKRLVDFCISSFIIIFILSWLIPLIGLIIMFESKGPVFFVQQRAGRNYKLFRLLKFRTMVADSKDVDETGSYNQARKGDPRITKIGAFLRRSSLDELPQFLNVWLGSMSVVGPRPHPQPLNQASMENVDDYMVRHFVKPGITGWAQVNGFRGETSTWHKMRERVKHDLWYCENWSTWLDIRIILKTIYVTLKGDQNAY